MDTPLTLKQPHALHLTRATDRLSYLYLERCAIRQDDNGTLAAINLDTTERTAYIPTANLTALLLGPGTSITQPAATALARNATTLTFVGAGAIRSYGSVTPLATSSHLLLRQAAIVTDPDLRLAVAKAMYLRRFPETFTPAGQTLTIEQLRGMEGIRIRGLYQTYAKKHRIKNWRRIHAHNQPDIELDAVNTALNWTNTALYSTITGIIQSLGLSPALGIIHTGNAKSFTLDIADLYKAELTIPLAFSLHNHPEPGREALRRLRTNYTIYKLIPRIVEDIHTLLAETPTTTPTDAHDWDLDPLYLWAPGATTLSGPNHAALPHELTQP